MTYPIELTINGEFIKLDIPANWRLIDVLRRDLSMTGTHEGCGEGDCGACTVLVNGQAVSSCLMLAVEANGCEIQTIEGLADGDILHPIQEAFIEVGAIQCGFCTPGMIMTSKALLDKHADPSEEVIRRTLAGNLCRCTGYEKIVSAVKAVSSKLLNQTDSIAE
ncbi:(2Fe-2S)-binding protein [candidate division LCP-89 bacterium B3_LCP]|uniref:(2Fe-2S)-binding protein n=1 Tax=candidate division LCP-89 bacterium B3_LCP TaxID=2012998 RepID=A0A532V5A3_UNCL8|nr:MAG: (2Fe-2S)-binding protein [candidate division LCP-89 bacterium B3_LCP]